MIIANFTGNKNRISVGGACQYDYGQVLRIQGLSLPANVEVHFSLNETFGESVRRIGTTKDGVTEVAIPDSMFEGDGTQADQYYYFYVFIYLSDETSGETEYFINVQTKCRPRPADFAPPDNPDFTGEVIEKLNDLEVSKLSKPSTAEVGQMLRVKSINDDGTYDIEGSDISFGEEAKEEIKKVVSSYIEENPIEETDPTVPEWAKQPNKPTYTAEEVGALSKDTKVPSIDDVNENTRVRHEHNNKEVLDEINEQSVQKWDSAYSHSTSVHAPENAQENIIEDIKVNGSSLDVTDKSVEISVPTKTSDIENDSGFLTNVVNDLVNYYLKSEVYTKEEVQSLIGRISSLELIKVEALPTDNIKISAIYLVPSSQSKENNVYTEYLYIDEKWEIIGDTSIDLSQYALKAEIPTKLSQLTNDANYSQFSGSYNDLNDKPNIPEQITKTSELENDSGFLVSPLSASVGQIFKVQSVNEDGTLVIEAVDMPSSDVTDVQINGTSIVSEDGVAEIPLGSATTTGVVRPSSMYGTTISDSSKGTIGIAKCNNSDIDARSTNYKPVVPTNLDYAVKAAMCDGKGKAWTDEEKAAARDRMNVESKWNEFFYTVTSNDIEGGEFTDNVYRLYVDGLLIGIGVENPGNIKDIEFVSDLYFSEVPIEGAYMGITNSNAWGVGALYCGFYTKIGNPYLIETGYSKWNNLWWDQEIKYKNSENRSLGYSNVLSTVSISEMLTTNPSNLIFFFRRGLPINTKIFIRWR